MVTNADLSANIRAEMARQRRTSKGLAEEIGMSPRQFGRRTRDEAEWSGAELLAVACALHVPADALGARS